jgi:hypothetical protein
VQDYIFIGSEPVFYPFLPDLSHSLEAEPGDIVAFKNPPTDGLWLPVAAPPKASARKSAQQSEEE